jgi:hypothetical protein
MRTCSFVPERMSREGWSVWLGVGVDIWGLECGEGCMCRCDSGVREGWGQLM